MCDRLEKVLINGVSILENSGYSIFYITCLSDELKELIRNFLVPICHGVKKTEKYQNSKSYSYENTIKEFIKRYDNKTTKQKKGLIGEFLFHVLLCNFKKEFTTNTPFFNLEERNVKKGFDAVLTKTGTTELWIAEVKSGELNKGKQNELAKNLLNTAKRDLVKRLPDSFSLWQNAINGAEVAISEARSEKEAFISLLTEMSDKSSNNEIKSSDVNVVLVGTVFAGLQNKVFESEISKKYQELSQEHIFKNIYLFVIQKELYQKVYNFLKEEGKESDE